MNSNIPPPYKPPAAPVIEPAGATIEPLLQRLRYFENLVEEQAAYIETLKGVITRTGHAVPTAYFAPLKGTAGDYTPKSG